jgi:nucleotide-binding universal stress UspA family protein
MERVVVGTDGSVGAAAAVEFAAHEATLRAATLRIVCAWGTPETVYASAFAPHGDVATQHRKAAHRICEEARERALKLEPSLECETCAAEGHPATVLVDEARKATLLVVGSRGLSGLKSILLGSIGFQCVHQSPVPVVIVPPPGRETAAT